MRNMNGRSDCGDCPDQQMDMRCRPVGCDENSSQYNDPLCGMPVGMGYVPWQQWGKTYDPAKGLCNGTIFPALNLPFYGCIPRGCRTRGGAL